MSTDIWNLERDLCRCCHSEGVFNDLAESCYLADQKKNYSDMIKECIDLLIHSVPGVLAGVTYKICNACIQRLKDAFEFKRQVQACEEKFQRYYDWNAIRVKNENCNVLDIKEETKEPSPVENGRVLDIKFEGSDTLSDWNEDFTNNDVEDIIIEERDWNQESSDDDNSFTIENNAVHVADKLPDKSTKKTTRRDKKRVKKRTKKSTLKKSSGDTVNDGLEPEESKKAVTSERGARPKFKRKFISLQQKLDILDQLNNGKTSTVVAKNLDLNESTIRTIKQNEGKIRSAVKSRPLQTLIKYARVRNPLLNTKNGRILDDSNRR